MTTSPLAPSLYPIERVIHDLEDTFTFHFDMSRTPLRFVPGQFNMLYAFGAGEVAISISGDPAAPERLVHTIRAVGTVTRPLCALRRGELVGIRGPYGVGWPVEAARGKDVLVVAGGLGLAPLRPAILHLVAHREVFGRIAILYGTRTPKDILFRKELERWKSHLDTVVEVTVDRAGTDWHGHVGVVTELIDHLDMAPESTVAFVCGPEVMMRFAARALEKRGVPRQAIHVSLERNMKCGVGYCGHCQLGPVFVCKDGPVFPYDGVARLLSVRER